MDADEINSDLREIEGDMNNPVFTWQGEDYICSTSMPSSIDILGQDGGGYNDDVRVTLQVRKELFQEAIYPQKKDLITFNSIVYRIDRIDNDIWSTHFLFHCINPNAGI